MTTNTSLSEQLHHLDRPARIALIGAMDQEVELLKQNLSDLESHRLSGFDFFTGTMKGVEIILLKSGIGKVNAAIGTTLLLQMFKPDGVINTGSAGGFDETLDVGDVVISERVCHHDVDLTVFGYEPGQVPGLPPKFTADPLLSRFAEESIAGMSSARTVRGLIATGDSFMNCPERVAETRKHFPSVKAVEMEAAAIAQTCHQFGTPFIVIRALSDIAGKESNLSFEQFLEKAATHSAEMVMAIIAKIASYSLNK
ncbi:5'-methylthioadenosine/S-adenosylhomocysteine nucleosidase [Marinobacterium sp. AK62]|uniref:5'-methylthioadenosine/S-adenosylhomocysteine nucleosidase n=1 Tax=Marinobacterium alkalitolerans TaxID=1542925 RepID=A0ABS3ZDU2_9GAMM|nr:5'-methylthioadenosine/S-adenosylhomocysteine nucleosidase [Marinobacterium alkalitolerans]MBP0049199.1 5'-methylthioadenosine/S-adenosylhomocysteine nucleosidase [Marinobacterium alkalitolerans]